MFKRLLLIASVLLLTCCVTTSAEAQCRCRRPLVRVAVAPLYVARGVVNRGLNRAYVRDARRAHYWAGDHWYPGRGMYRVRSYWQ